MVREQGPRQGTVEYLRLLKLASEGAERDLALLLVEYVCPPYPAWTVAMLRGWLHPAVRLAPALADLQPEWSSYDALLTASQEVAHAG